MLRFLTDTTIPPTSNQAERDLPPPTTAQKITGPLRPATTSLRLPPLARRGGRAARRRSISGWSAAGGKSSAAAAQAATGAWPSGAGTPASCSSCRAIRMSFSINRSPKPESYASGRMNVGHFTCVDPLRPLELFTMLSMTSGSSPN